MLLMTMTMTTKYVQILSCLGTDPALRCESNPATELPDQLRLQHPSITTQPTSNLDQLNCVHGEHTYVHCHPVQLALALNNRIN